VVQGSDFAHVGAVAIASFFASFVECIEVLAVVLALALVRGRSAALVGSLAGFLVLFFATWILVESLAGVPVSTEHLIVGALLLLFGLRWLREAMLRSLRAIPLHDLAALYAKEVTALEALKRSSSAFDVTAAVRAMRIVIFDGVEVVFIVVALGASESGLLAPATAGAVLAALVIVPLGFVFYRPVAAPLINSLKLAAGVLLSAFGTIWAGDGIGAVWPRPDATLIALALGYLLVAIGYVRMVRRGRPAGGREIS